MKRWMWLPLALALVGAGVGALGLSLGDPLLFFAGVVCFAASFFVEGSTK